LSCFDINGKFVNITTAFIFELPNFYSKNNRKIVFYML